MSLQDTPTLKNALALSAEKYADRPAVCFVGEEPMTYREFKKLVDDISLLLHSRSITKGDKVAILSENMPNWGAAYLAITCMGAVAIPILTEFHEGAVHHILRHSESKAIFVSERLRHKVDEYESDNLHTTITINDFSLSTEDGLRQTFKEGMVQARKSYEQVKEQVKERISKELEKYTDKGKEYVRPSTEIDVDDVAAILYTSGTTGSSKGVILTHRNIVFNAMASANIIDVNTEDRLVSVLPLAHTFECTLGMVLPLIHGASIHYLPKPPTPKTLLPAMAKVKPTLLLIVPLIIEKIFKNRVQPKLKGSGIMRNVMKLGAARKKLYAVAGKKLMEAFGGQLRCMPIGGAFLAPEVEDFLVHAGLPYSVGYGMTETSPLCSGDPASSTRFRSAGRILKGMEIKIDKPDPQTGEGEILVKGPNVMQGYYKAPKVTEEVLMEDGFLRTGDLGYIDEDGYIFLRGRLKNVIIGPSGENIYPEEVESIIGECDFVLESLVYRADGKLVARVHLDNDTLDEKLGTGKMIESKAREAVQNHLDSIKKTVNGKVSSFSRLAKVIEQVEPFEKTPTKKIKRYLYIDMDENQKR
ncbi:AMP-binding protein [Maridesulfovibrio sp.]|uniref:AMP-binding protein n=1 Tax=unclassified Maridesulfovibrio TaxID=2794999 RepID=UPI003B00B188